MTPLPGRVRVGALAKYVHASHLRHKATGRVRCAEIAYDEVFPSGACILEQTHSGDWRVLSLDESVCINVKAADAPGLFRIIRSDG